MFLQLFCKTFEIFVGYNNNRNKKGRGETAMRKIYKSDVGRGITVALISAGITAVAILPLFLMQLLDSLI
jgi:hypothetical protein